MIDVKEFDQRKSIFTKHFVQKHKEALENNATISKKHSRISIALFGISATAGVVLAFAPIPGISAIIGATAFAGAQISNQQGKHRKNVKQIIRKEVGNYLNIQILSEIAGNELFRIFEYHIMHFADSANDINVKSFAELLVEGSVNFLIQEEKSLKANERLDLNIEKWLEYIVHNPSGKKVGGLSPKKIKIDVVNSEDQWILKEILTHSGIEEIANTFANNKAYHTKENKHLKADYGYRTACSISGKFSEKDKEKFDYTTVGTGYSKRLTIFVTENDLQEYVDYIKGGHNEDFNTYIRLKLELNYEIRARYRGTFPKVNEKLLGNLNFQNVDFIWVNFSGVYLENVNFKNAILIGADFSDAELKGVDFSNSNMKLTNFTGAKIINNTIFERANLTGIIIDEKEPDFSEDTIFYLAKGVKEGDLPGLFGTSVEVNQELERLKSTSNENRRNINKLIASQEKTCEKRKKPIIILPGDRKDFIGREEELKQIEHALTDHNENIITQTISGMGGIGKSHLAWNYALQNEKKYHMIVFINVMKEEKILERFEELATKLNKEYEAKITIPNFSIISSFSNNQGINSLDDKNAPIKCFIQKIYKALHNTEKQWLLVFDDIRNKDAIKDYLPEVTHKRLGHILITSRNRECWDNPICLTQFTWPESIFYILHKRERNFCSLENLNTTYQEVLYFAEEQNKVTDEDWIINNYKERLNEKEKDALELAYTLSSHPLALSQALAYISKRKRTTIEKYIESFNKKPLHRWKRENDYFNDGKINWENDKTVYGTMSLSLDAIKQESENNSLSETTRLQAKAAFDLLCICAFLHNEEIDYEVALSALAYFDPIESNSETDSSESEEKEELLDGVLSILTEHSLLQHNDTDKKVFGIHQLVQFATRMYIDIQIKDYEKFSKKVMEWLNSEMGYSKYATNEIILQNILYALHIENLLSILKQDLLIDLNHKLGQYYIYYIQDNKKGKNLLDQAKEESISEIKKASILNDMGYSFIDENREQGIKCVEEAIRITEGKDDITKLDSYIVLSQLNIKKKQYRDANEYIDKALSLQKLNEYHPDKLQNAEIYYTKGEVLYHQKDYENALREFEKALNIYNEYSIHKKILKTMNQKCCVLDNQNNFEESVKTRKKMIDIELEYLNTKYPPEIVAIIQYTANIAYVKARCDLIKELFEEKFCDIYDTGIGEELEEIYADVSSHLKLGELEEAYEKYQDAFYMLEEAYEKYREVSEESSSEDKILTDSSMRKSIISLPAFEDSKGKHASETALQTTHTLQEEKPEINFGTVISEGLELLEQCLKDAKEETVIKAALEEYVGDLKGKIESWTEYRKQPEFERTEDNLKQEIDEWYKAYDAYSKVKHGVFCDKKYISDGLEEALKEIRTLLLTYLMNIEEKIRNFLDKKIEKRDANKKNLEDCLDRISFNNFVKIDNKNIKEEIEIAKADTSNINMDKLLALAIGNDEERLNNSRKELSNRIKIANGKVKEIKNMGVFVK